MPYILHQLHGSQVGCYLLEGRITLGRAPDNDIVLDDPTVSGYHAVIEPAPEGGFMIRDLGSTNGVMVQGKRQEQSPVSSGMSLLIGTHDLSVVEQPPEPLEKTLTIKKSWIPGVYYVKD